MQSSPCHQSNGQMERQEPHVRSGGRRERTWLKLVEIGVVDLESEEDGARTFKGKTTTLSYVIGF